MEMSRQPEQPDRTACGIWVLDPTGCPGTWLKLPVLVVFGAMIKFHAPTGMIRPAKSSANPFGHQLNYGLLTTVLRYAPRSGTVVQNSRATTHHGAKRGAAENATRTPLSHHYNMPYMFTPPPYIYIYTISYQRPPPHVAIYTCAPVYTPRARRKGISTKPSWSRHTDQTRRQKCASRGHKAKQENMRRVKVWLRTKDED